MKARQLAVVVALVAAPFAIAAEEENPYKKAKVGDFATYKIVSKLAGQNIEGTLTQIVTAKDDKEATVKASGKATFMGMEIPIPEREEKIDLSKPFDPTKGNVPPGTEAKIEKLKDGTEKLKVAGKEYATKWETFKLKMKAMGMEFEGDMKVWQSKDLNIPVVKMEMTTEVMGQKMEIAMELTETGNKEPEKKKPEDKKPEDKKKGDK